MFYAVETSYARKEILIFDSGSLDLEWERWSDVDKFIRQGVNIENAVQNNLSYGKQQKDSIVLIRYGRMGSMHSLLGTEAYKYYFVEYDRFKGVDLKGQKLISDKYPCWLQVLGEGKLKLQYYDYFYDITFNMHNVTINDKKYEIFSKKSRDKSDGYAHFFKVTTLGISNGRFIIKLHEYREDNVTMMINANGGISCALFGLKVKEIIGKPLKYEASKRRLMLSE